ncbi:hypothetical protein KM043_003210 [Ampulex compressa]|nr:hypothetical protein KM043_003210 [Ampulex compressa]
MAVQLTTGYTEVAPCLSLERSSDPAHPVGTRIAHKIGLRAPPERSVPPPRTFLTIASRIAPFFPLTISASQDYQRSRRLTSKLSRTSPTLPWLNGGTTCLSRYRAPTSLEQGNS